MIWFLIQQIGFFTFVFFTVKFVIQKKYESLLELYVWGLVFASFYQFALTIWFPSKVVSVGMLICLLQFSKKYSKTPQIVRNFFFIFLLLIIFSDLIAVLLPGNIQIDISPFTRLIIQNYAYISALILISYGSILKKNFAHRLFFKYYFIMECCIVIGLIHFLCFKIGIEFMPILRQDGNFNLGTEVVADFGGQVVNRIYGFAGEPKNLGYILVPFLVMSFFMYLKGIIRKSRTYHLSFLILGFWVVFNTFSSSALISLIISIILVSLVYNLKFNPKILGLGIIIAGSVFIFVLINEGIYLTSNDNISFTDALHERTFGRAQDELNNDRQETVIWNTFSEDQLTYKIFGYGIAQYTFHIRNQSTGNTLIPVQSGIVLTLVDFGVLGLIFYFVYGLLILKYLLVSKRRNDILSSAFFIVTIVSYIGSLMYGNITSSFMFFMIAIYNYSNNPKYEMLLTPKKISINCVANLSYKKL